MGTSHFGAAVPPLAPQPSDVPLTPLARLTALTIAAATMATVLAGCDHGPSRPARDHPATGQPSATHDGSTVTTAPPTTTSAPPATTTTSPAQGAVTSPPLPAPGAGFVSGHVTAVGDSVMMDYQDPLQHDIPGVSVDAAVSRQWYQGEAILEQLKAAGQLGSVVVVGLSTNGPITSADFDAMMAIVQGASRVVFVTIHVDQPWQDPNNQVLESGAARYPHVEVADWATLADQNPGYLYSDGTHLPIDGPGAQALAALIASKV